MFTLTLKLDCDKRQKELFDKRFSIYTKLKNTEIKYSQKMVRCLERDKQYIRAKNEYIYLKKNKSIDLKRLSQLSKIMNERRKHFHLTNFDLKMYIRPMRNKYKKYISSQQGQTISESVYKSVEDYLFGDGEKLHFKRAEEVLSIPQTTNNNGVRVFKDKSQVEWNEEFVKVKIKHSDFENRCFEREFKFAYIKRKMFASGWDYYITLIFEGNPPLKYNPSHKYDAGLDLGTSTFAIVKDNEAILDNLSPKAKEYKTIIKTLDHKIENSKRLMNPENYKDNGTIKNGKLTWKYSKRCLRLKRLRKTLFRKQSDYILQNHRENLNRILKDINQIVIEPMEFKKLQRRIKKTEKSDKKIIVINKRGKSKEIYKFKKKKRFGNSISLHAPGLFQSELKRKCELYFIKLKEINTVNFKASKFNHETGKYDNVSLKERNKIIDGYRVQRDLYSAFLIKNTEINLDKPDIQQCKKDFKKFVELQNLRIEYMKQNKISNKACFGF